jgi:ubiquinone/menaquinone biosynthesis C-methylase UbiE
MITGAAENIPLPDTSVDLIFSNNGLNNVADINSVLSECRRISKPGTQLVFTYNTDRTMVEVYSAFEEILLKNNLKKEFSLMKEHIYQKRKPVEEYVGLLNDHGYIINEISPTHFEHRCVDGTAMFNHFLIRLAFINSWKEIIPQEKQNKIFTELEEKLNDFASQHGGLKMTIPFTLIDCIQAGE